MRFVIKQAGCGSERVGCLTGFAKFPRTVIETPTSALLTQGGSVVHLTADVLSHVFPEPRLLWVPLSNTHQLEPGVKAQGHGIAKFAGVSGHVTCMTLHNINEVTPSGHFEYDRVPLWTKNGKRMITANRYMDVMEVFKPDIILAIADGRTSLTEGIKRTSKSVERTCNMFDVCVERYKGSKLLLDTSFFGVIAGAGCSKRCDDCIQHILKHKEHLGGIVLEGLTDGTEESFAVSNDELESVFRRVNEAIPKDLVRVVEGCWNPAVIVSAIEHGWDVFDGSYPNKLSNAGHALALQLDVNRNSDELCILDLNDERYKEDFKPILDGCECLACKKHTRAYIRHLLNTREMLANVLLSIHNLHHFDQIFHHARQHIAANTFQVYKCHITKQYESYRTSISTNGTSNGVEDTVVSNEDSTHLKKKKRVSNETHNLVNGIVDK